MFDNETRQEVINTLIKQFPEVVAILEHCHDCSLQEISFKDLSFALTRSMDLRAVITY
jgi:hypothetical protein